MKTRICDGQFSVAFTAAVPANVFDFEKSDSLSKR